MDGRASARHWQSKQRLTTLPDPTTFTKPDASSAFPTQFATAPIGAGNQSDLAAWFEQIADTAILLLGDDHRLAGKSRL